MGRGPNPVEEGFLGLRGVLHSWAVTSEEALATRLRDRRRRARDREHRHVRGRLRLVARRVARVVVEPLRRERACLAAPLRVQVDRRLDHPHAVQVAVLVHRQAARAHRHRYLL